MALIKKFRVIQTFFISSRSFVLVFFTMQRALRSFIHCPRFHFFSFKNKLRPRPLLSLLRTISSINNAKSRALALHYPCCVPFHLSTTPKAAPLPSIIPDAYPFIYQQRQKPRPCPPLSLLRTLSSINNTKSQPPPSRLFFLCVSCFVCHRYRNTNKVFASV